MNLDFRSDMILAGAREFEQAHHDGHACGECRFAQMFAVQPRALCTHPGAEYAGRVLPAARPSCRSFSARPADALELAQFLAPVGAPAPVAWPQYAHVA